MLLDIVTPERRVRSIKNADVRLPAESDDVILPGVKGQFEVFPGHAPFLAQLATGVLSFRAEGRLVRLMVSGGFAEVDRDRVTVMCEAAALPEEVEAADEQQSLADIERRLQALTTSSAGAEEGERLRVESERIAARLALLK